MDTIVFIGAGRVASHLAPALHAQGFHISQVFSRTETSARTLAERVESSYTDDLSALDTTADLYIYSVSDSALPELAAQIHIPEAIHIHTSGSTGMNIYEGLAGHYGVLYPLQTFSKDKTVRFEDVSFFLEGSNEYARNKIYELARTLSPKLFFMDSTGRQKLHLSAVFVCNFVNHMYEIGAELMKDAGADFELLLPLIEETTEKIKTLTPYDAQTGPAVRNDLNIVQKHLALLEGKRTLSDMYQMITEDIYNIHK